LDVEGQRGQIELAFKDKLRDAKMKNKSAS
jgi:hypothetical protein